MKVILIICLSFFSLTCRTFRNPVVPEITPNLELIRLTSVNPEKELRLLAATSESFFLQTRQEHLQRISPKKEIMLISLPLKIPFTTPATQYDELLFFGPGLQGECLIFDLLAMEPVLLFSLPEKAELLAFDRSFVLYSLEKALYNFNLENKQSLLVARLSTKPLSAARAGDWTVILCQEQLLLYHYHQQKAEFSSLRERAVSPGLLVGDHLYYGSDSRRLIKLNWRNNRLAWRRLLPETITVKPVSLGPYIVFAGHDNNAYYFRSNGNIHWWHSLGSQMQYGPLPMTDNVAYLTLNGMLHFADPRKRSVQRLKIEPQTDQEPLIFAGRVYLVSSSEEEKREIWQAGNTYEVKMAIEPQFTKFCGQSVKLQFEFINLLQPRTSIEITGPGGQVILNRTLEYWENPVIAFIPEQEGEYRVNLLSQALNKAEEKSISFLVVDPLGPAREYFFSLQDNCRGN